MSLAELGWRSFNFFNISCINDPEDSTRKATILPVVQGIEITCWSPATSFVLFGEPAGAIFSISQNFEVRFWKAFKLNLFDFVYRGHVLVSLGVDDSQAKYPVLKLWDVDQWEEAWTSPNCLSSFHVNVGSRKTNLQVVQPSFVAINDSLDFAAIGYEDTSIYFFNGDFRRERSPKFKALREGSSALGDGKLVGLVLATVHDRTALVIITDCLMRSYILDSSGTVLLKLSHDAKGCLRRCWHFDPTSNQLIIAAREMVHFYDLNECLQVGNENGRCYALSRWNDKLQVLSKDDYVALLTRQTSLLGAGGESQDISILTIYDVQHRYIAFYASIPTICQMFLLNDELHIINAQGMISKLIEEPLTAKLDHLLNKNLFDLAISIASENDSENLLKGIYLRYGDYLYKKGDFENSIQQYIETIGFTEPSYVIKKFIDGPRVNQLCLYLETLHQKGESIDQHTILLITAYVKINAPERLQAFLDKHTSMFDIDEALKVLRAAKFFDIAAKLALKQKQIRTFLAILIEDSHDFEGAIDFISKLPPEQISIYLNDFGALLLNYSESKTLELIKMAAKSKDADLQNLMHLLCDQPDQFVTFFSEIQKENQITDPLIRNKLMDIKLRGISRQKEPMNQIQMAELASMVDSDNFSMALHLAQVYKNIRFTIYLLKKQNRLEELLRYILHEGTVQDVLEHCGEIELRDMWIELITYLSSKENCPKEQLMVLLKKATECNFIQPLVLLEILSKNDTLTVGDIREYILKWLEQQNQVILDNEVSIKENEGRLDEMLKTIEDLENNVQLFQVSKCSVCNNELQIPAVHFLCKHAFHLNCYESYSGAQHDKGTNEKSSTSENFSIHQFRDDLKTCSDTASLISKYLSMGIFDAKQPEKPHDAKGLKK